MKNLLFVLLLAAMLFIAGCTGGNQNPAGTPVQGNPQVTASQNLPSAPTAPAVTATTALTPGSTTAPRTFSVTASATPFPTGTSAGIPVEGSFATYANKEFGYSIQIPACWTASGEYQTTPGGGKKYKVTFDDPSLRSMQYITITPESSGLSLDEWTNIFLNKQKSDSSVSILGQSPLQIDGTPAKKIILTTGTGEYAIESTIIMAVKGDNAYFMEFASRKNDYSAYAKESDAMIQTFRFG